MFAYNPTVNDNSGQILAEAHRFAKEQKAKEQQQFWQSISDGISSVTSSLGDALDDVKANAIKYDTAAGMMDAYKQMGPQMGITAEDIDALGTKYANKPDSLIASLTVLGRVADNNMSMQRQQAQVDGYKDLYDYKSANAPVKPPAAQKYDFNYATEFNKALYDKGITDPEQRKQKFNEAGVGHLYDKFINPPKQNMGFFGPVTQ